MTHVTFRLTAKNRDQLRNPMLGSGVWATFTFYRLSRVVPDEGPLNVRARVLQVLDDWLEGC